MASWNWEVITCVRYKLLQHLREGKGKGVLHGEQRGVAFPMERTFMGEGGRDQFQG